MAQVPWAMSVLSCLCTPLTLPKTEFSLESFRNTTRRIMKKPVAPIFIFGQNLWISVPVWPTASYALKWTNVFACLFALGKSCYDDNIFLFFHSWNYLTNFYYNCSLISYSKLSKEKSKIFGSKSNWSEERWCWLFSRKWTSSEKAEYCLLSGQIKCMSGNAMKTEIARLVNLNRAKST